MPYIKPGDRPDLDDRLGPLVEVVLSPGEQNYVITSFLLAQLGAKPNYAGYEAVLGRLAAIQLELYRRRIAPYEDEKCTENGDVY